MKKLVSILSIIVILCSFSMSFAYAPEMKVNYTFAGTRYGISNIDTNGEIFVGVNERKIAVSSDFQNWKILQQLDDVTAVEYLKGSFCAFTKGYTLVSADGKNWEKVSNNLEYVPDQDLIIKNKGSVVLFAYNESKMDGGTFQTFDGINWKRVENIPNGQRMSIVNGYIMFDSKDYMRGIYYSETGESFKCVHIDGYDEAHGGFNLEYHDGEYFIYDYWRSVDGEAEEGDRIYLYRSKDMENWTTEIVSKNADGRLNNLGGNYIKIKDAEHALSINGHDYVIDDGKWTTGEYNGMTKLHDVVNGVSPSQPYVYYNFTDYGVFAWATNKNSCFIDNDGKLIFYDGNERNISHTYLKEGKFYASAYTMYGGETLWVSDNGSDWKASEEKPENITYSTFASNGGTTLQTELIPRGSYRFREENKEITGTLTEPDKTVKKIVFEGTKNSDTMHVLSGNGYYLMGDYENDYFYSSDGITREFKIEFPYISGNLLANDKYFMYTKNGNIIYTGEMKQFENLPGKDSIIVKLNDEYLSFEAAPVIENDRTLVPARFLFERMGATVDWIEEESAAVIVYGETTVKLVIDSNVAIVNEEEYILEAPARLIESKTMLPLRFISEKMGFKVNYFEDTNTAEILK